MGVQLWSRMVPSLRTSLKPGGWQSPEDKKREDALLTGARVVHGSKRHQYGGKQPVQSYEPCDEEDGAEEDDESCDYEQHTVGDKRARK